MVVSKVSTRNFNKPQMVPNMIDPRVEKMNTLDRAKAEYATYHKNHSFEDCHLKPTLRADLHIPMSVGELPSGRSILKSALGSKRSRPKSVSHRDIATPSNNAVSKNSASRQVGFRQEDIDRKKK